MSVATNPHGPNHPISRPRPRVVVADDHPAVLVRLRRILEPHCDLVAAAADGEELLQHVEHLLPDAVVTDICMPVVNGLEACRRIRRTHPTVRVIVVTEMDDEDVFAEAVQVGASATLRKHEIAEKLPAALLAGADA